MVSSYRPASILHLSSCTLTWLLMDGDWYTVVLSYPHRAGVGCASLSSEVSDSNLLNFDLTHHQRHQYPSRDSINCSHIKLEYDEIMSKLRQ